MVTRARSRAGLGPSCRRYLSKNSLSLDTNFSVFPGFLRDDSSSTRSPTSNFRKRVRLVQLSLEHGSRTLASHVNSLCSRFYAVFRYHVSQNW
ncbi:hypothetical protein LAZ67_13000620 [Cordylochernes scorpioides]|uniref:Uncharacterized protein n=1 Tax=Cordylochernes scorpioides TaxID=51811 RepID=A0ABY6L3K6_9ARAC|nr:hypothetical protein LAZ67_13000620 [Cordylochernes scorpioides]